MHRRVVAAAPAAVGLCAAAASGASAAPVALGGTPMNVYVGELGQLQACRAGLPDGIYYRPDSTEGDAGFFLAVLDSTNTVFGFNGNAGPHGTTDYTLGSQGAVTGSGTAGDPLKQVTTYRTAATSALQVTQTTTCVNGTQFFTVRWDVTNATGSAAHFKALAAADFFFDGSDRGTGIYTQRPPQFIGGTNADTGNSGGFAEVPGTTAWSRYQALAYGSADNEVWGKVNGAAASANSTLDDTVVGEQVDNAGGVEWDQYATGAGLGSPSWTQQRRHPRDAEPQASALATFVDDVAPSCKVKVSGDRPGGSGGAGKPLIITVNCTSRRPSRSRRR